MVVEVVYLVVEGGIYYVQLRGTVTNDWAVNVMHSFDLIAEAAALDDLKVDFIGSSDGRKFRPGKVCERVESQPIYGAKDEIDQRGWNQVSKEWQRHDAAYRSK